METSAQSEQVLELGRRLVKELGLDDSTDTLGRWMAHHLSDLILRAETAVGNEKRTAQSEAFDAILAIWRHRSELPDGKRPFEDLEPIIRAVESLDPEDRTPRYFRPARPPRGEAGTTPEQEKWLETVEGLDYSAKVLIGYCLEEAAGAAVDKAQEWVKQAEGISDAGAPEIAIRVVSSPWDLEKEPDPNAKQRKLLSDRVKRLRAFIGVAESVAEVLSERLAGLPPAPADTPERIVLSEPPPLEDPFEGD